jgi:hypothetical protein
MKFIDKQQKRIIYTIFKLILSGLFIPLNQPKQINHYLIWLD